MGDLQFAFYQQCLLFEGILSKEKTVALFGELQGRIKFRYEQNGGKALNSF